MKTGVLISIGAFLLFGWGVAYLTPTRNVILGFGEISADNKRIIQMGWITEGVALLFIGVLVAIVTCLDRISLVSKAVYWTSFGVLNVLSSVSLFTRFRNSLIVFKLCPVIFTGSSILMVIGGLIG